VRDLAAKFSGAKTFIEALEEAVPYFYEQVGQHLRPYVATPPKIKVELTEESLTGIALGGDAVRASPPTEQAEIRKNDQEPALDT
jgi:hypothetical protein